MPVVPLARKRFTATSSTCVASASTCSCSSACSRLQPSRLIGELLEFGLGLEELGGRLVGLVLGILDLGRRPLRRLLVRAAGWRGRGAAGTTIDEADQAAPIEGCARWITGGHHTEHDDPVTAGCQILDAHL